MAARHLENGDTVVVQGQEIGTIVRPSPSGSSDNNRIYVVRYPSGYIDWFWDGFLSSPSTLETFFP